ncbi:CCT domain-containing protein [Artemisia annua]|uniref:CCT domain-containing protein n=1 Tax=Artemisia annua TaxID=35608 RepID=A0A2U1NDZ9_ARTAN|nr:CCT domain-containing protein [Artemisia annua]
MSSDMLEFEGCFFTDPFSPLSDTSSIDILKSFQENSYTFDPLSSTLTHENLDTQYDENDQITTSTNSTTLLSSSPPSHQLENLSLYQMGNSVNSLYLSPLEVKTEETQSQLFFNDYHVNTNTFLPHSYSECDNVVKMMQRSFSSKSFDGRSNGLCLQPKLNGLIESSKMHSQVISSSDHGFSTSHMRRVCSAGDLQVSLFFMHVHFIILLLSLIKWLYFSKYNQLEITDSMEKTLRVMDYITIYAKGKLNIHVELCIQKLKISNLHTHIAHYDPTSTKEKFRDIILGVIKYGGTSFLADFFPVFRHLDPNGSLKRSDPATRKLMAILEKHINDRMEERAKRLKTNQTSQTLSSSPLANEGSFMEEANFKVGRYGPEERKERILRYKAKRTQRNFNKTIKYACRKTLADNRPRVRGRFARNDEHEESHKSSYHRHEDDDELWMDNGLQEEYDGIARGKFFSTYMPTTQFNQFTYFQK